MVLVGYDQEQHHSFRDFEDCEELRYLTLLVPLRRNECLCLCAKATKLHFHFIVGWCSSPLSVWNLEKGVQNTSGTAMPLYVGWTIDTGVISEEDKLTPWDRLVTHYGRIDLIHCRNESQSTRQVKCLQSFLVWILTLLSAILIWCTGHDGSIPNADQCRPMPALIPYLISMPIIADQYFSMFLKFFSMPTNSGSSFDPA